MKVIAFYTKHTPYELVFNTRLKPSLDRLGIKYTFSEVSSVGSWKGNTCLKPVIILQAQEALKEDLLYLDSDAEVIEYPKLFDEISAEYDIAVHYLDWNKHYCRQNDGTKELLTGTLMIRNNEKTQKLLRDWINEGNRDTDQKTLERALKKNPNIKIYEFSEEYICIVDKMGNKPAYIKHPIIVHYQASRSYKNSI